VSDQRFAFRVRDARVRLLSDGPHVLAEAELLSLLLSVSGHQCANDVACDLLVRFGSLRALCTADRNETREAGLSDENHARLHAALELTRRHYQTLAIASGDVLNNPHATREYLHMRLRDLSYEVFVCIYLDVHRRVISSEQLFRGTVDGAIVHPREVVRGCLQKNAAALIVAHNHPSGVAEPSPADRAITARLQEALSTFGIKLVDHLIIGDGVCESFADRGLL
jgi:DNA repair protein RadC